MTAPIQFRPHHFLCALGFQGKGYSDVFTANLARIVDGLRAPGGDQTEIVVTGSADSICTPCPHRRGATCAKAAKIAALDHRHAAALRIAKGDRLTWEDAKARIRLYVAPGALKVLCDGCQWYDLGLCERSLSALHALPKEKGRE
ncbi:MAG: DUF1284 domain-containing protein [Roseinatronobacter sp.]